MDQLNAIYDELNDRTPKLDLTNALSSPRARILPGSHNTVSGEAEKVMDQALFKDERRRFLQKRVKQIQPSKSKSTPRLRNMP